MDVASLIQRYDSRVPRYTSYPTAPHFSAAVTGAQYRAWLAELPVGQPLSLYLHVPFCEQLCLYCGCNTAVARHAAPRLSYAESMAREIALVADALGTRHTVRHIHWGGGTPTALPACSLRALMALLRARFNVAADAEVAVELDPRHVPADRLEALANMGITRASIGVQDFSPAVQQAVGRVQDYALTSHVVDQLRGIGIASINVDLMYGLPYQTAESVVQTVHQTVALAPDRIAVFGYAHVPWMKRQQALLPVDKLPDPASRFAQRAAIAAALVAQGYHAIGLDHFARAEDSLGRAHAQGALRRNFQGYTADDAPTLIGFGVSAIGSLPQGYAQNETTVPAYRAAIAQGNLPIAKGIACSADDLLRRDIIERVMCRLEVDLPEIAAAHGADPAPLLAAAPSLAQMQQDGLITWNGHQLRVTEPGRPFVRNVAAAFDRYLAPNTTQHATSI